MAVLRKSLGVLLGAALLGVGTAYIRLDGNPVWPNARYCVTIDSDRVGWVSAFVLDALYDWSPGSFPTSLKISSENKTGLPDDQWEDHDDKINTWSCQPRKPNETWLALTFVRHDGKGRMTDADVVFWEGAKWEDVSRWPQPAFGPDKDHDGYSLRGVLRHEVAHAIGFGHENKELSVTNSIVSIGSTYAHGYARGMLPHATDKQGLFTVYPPPDGTDYSGYYNWMVTCWKPPASADVPAKRLFVKGRYALGSRLPAEVYMENQGPAKWKRVRLRWFLSKDRIYDKQDLKLRPDELVLLSSWEQALRVPYLTIPQDTPAGDYFVGAFIDPPNDQGNDQYAEAYEADNQVIVGKVTVCPEVRLRSSNPSSGVVVRAKPDLRGRSNVTTPNTLVYSLGVWAYVEAPLQVGRSVFRRWVVDGRARADGARVIWLRMSQHCTAVAEYTAAPPSGFRTTRASCAAGGASRPILEGIGRSTPGSFVTFRVRNAGRYAPGVLQMGLGTHRGRGVGGCTTSVNPVGWWGTPRIRIGWSGSGSATWAVPRSGSLLGKTFHTEFVSYKYLGRALTGIGVSNRLTSVIGWVR